MGGFTSQVFSEKVSVEFNKDSSKHSVPCNIKEQENPKEKVDAHSAIQPNHQHGRLGKEKANLTCF